MGTGHCHGEMSPIKFEITRNFRVNVLVHFVQNGRLCFMALF